jgi:hypothetical protein
MDKSPGRDTIKKSLIILTSPGISNSRGIVFIVMKRRGNGV